MKKLVLTLIFFLFFPVPQVQSVPPQTMQILAQANRKAEANKLFHRGIQQAKTRQFRAAIRSLEKALKIYREIGNRRGEAASLSSLGLAYVDLGEYQKAIKFHQQSLDIVREIGDRRGESSSLRNLGNVYRSLGEYEKAINFYQQSLNIFREIEEKQLETSVLWGLGVTYVDLGEYEKAINFHQQSLDIFREIEDRWGEANSLGNLGNTYRSLGQYKKAINFHQQSLDIVRDIGDRRGEANSLVELGVTYGSLGQYKKAIKFYRQSLDINWEANSLNNLGNALHKAGKLAEAEKVLKKGIKAGEKIREGLSTANKLSIFEQQVRTYRHLQAVLIAQQKMEAALEVAERGRTRTLVELLAKDLDSPIQPPSLSEIKAIAQKQKATLVEYAVINDDVHIEGKEVGKESELYIWVIQPSGQVDFQSVDLTPLWKAKEFGTMPLLSSLRFFWEQKKPAWSFPLTVTTSLLALLSLLALIYFYRKTSRTKILVPWLLGFICLTSTGSLIFLLTSSQQFTSKDKTSESAFAQLITNTLESIGINSRGLGELAQPEEQQYTEENLKELHQLLIEPIAHLLPQDPQARVVFIPDQELFFVPFAALQDEQGKYLIDKHTILSSPSIQVLDLTQQRKARLSGTIGESLIVGNPKMPPLTVVPGEPPEDKLPPLRGSETEAKAIAELKEVQPLIGTNATETTVVEKMPQAKLIHLATHGLLNYSENIMPGVIALAQDEKNDGLLNAVDIYNMKLQADLVVLSACNTGLGEITSDGVIGLSRAFFNAGVPSLVVSLWNVKDNPTAPLMTEFYKNLQTNPDKAQALRQAMLTRKKVDPDPVNWAGFMLLGQAE